MSRFETYARLGGDDHFRQIAESNLKRFYELAPKVENLRERINAMTLSIDTINAPPLEYYDLQMELDPIEEERDQCCIIACVFTALYFEAFIYDYAASCLSDKYVLEHIDKLDFISKWVVVPRLTVGKELDKSRIAYSSLKKLHRDRNSLVHLKSRAMNLGEQAMVRYLKEREDGIKESAKNCKSCLDTVVKALHELDPEHPKLQFLTQK